MVTKIETTFPVERMAGAPFPSDTEIDRLEIPWTKIDESEFAMLSALSRGLTTVMPSSLKITGPEHLRICTQAIAQGRLG